MMRIVVASREERIEARFACPTLEHFSAQCAALDAAGRLAPLVIAAPLAPEGFPTDDEAMRLPAAARARLAEITHPARRRQSLAVRLAALTLFEALERASGRALSWIEEPPYGPRIEGLEAPLFLTFTHTEGAVGLSASHEPLGLDLERGRAPERLARTARHAFGDKAGAALEEVLLAQQDADPFLAFWGMKESAVKMNRGTAPACESFHFEVVPEDARLAARVWGPGTEALPVRLLFAAGVRLTIVGDVRPERILLI